jgi:hypothetical protein
MKKTNVSTQHAKQRQPLNVPNAGDVLNLALWHMAAHVRIVIIDDPEGKAVLIRLEGLKSWRDDEGVRRWALREASREADKPVASDSDKPVASSQRDIRDIPPKRENES